MVSPTYWGVRALWFEVTSEKYVEQLSHKHSCGFSRVFQDSLCTFASLETKTCDNSGLGGRLFCDIADVSGKLHVVTLYGDSGEVREAVQF